MAGGKETPRQKMIGMMYIVLTALLALQVSSAVMEKFILLDNSLKQSMREQEGRNDKTVEKIADKVAERKNQPKEVELQKDAKRVADLTHELVDDYLEETVRYPFIEFAGGTEDKTKEGKPKGAKDTEKTNQFFVGPLGTTNKEGYILKDKVNAYYEELRRIADKHDAKVILDPFTKDAKDLAAFKDSKEHKNKNFVQLYFEDSPVVAALATISEFESNIVRAESDVLNALAAKVGAADFKFDKIIPMSRADANVVASGTEYKAELFITATSSSIVPKIRVAGSDLKTNKDGVAEYKTRASVAGGSKQPDGTFKKTWSGTISIPNPMGGGDTAMPITGEYFVVQPVIQVQSGAVNALYKDCGNLLDILVPQLGSNYNPSFSCSGGELIKGKKKGQVIVIPSAPNVTIGVSSGGNKVGDVDFKVRLVPKPEIIAYNGGKPANLKQGEAAGGVRTITMKAVCTDNTFESNLPRDARYDVSEWEIMLVRGKRPVNKSTVNGSSFKASSLGEQREGDRLLIEVKSVTRKNFQNRTLPVNVGNPIINIPLS